MRSTSLSLPYFVYLPQALPSGGDFYVRTQIGGRELSRSHAKEAYIWLLDCFIGIKPDC